MKREFHAWSNAYILKFKFILDYLASQPVIYILIKLNGRK